MEEIQRLREALEAIVRWDETAMPNDTTAGRIAREALAGGGCRAGGMMDMRDARELWAQVPEIPECDHTALVRLMERMSAEPFAELRAAYREVLLAQMAHGRELGGLWRVAEKL